MGGNPPSPNKRNRYKRNRHMSNYHRNYVQGGTYFFTVVTYVRQRILQGKAIDALRESFRQCMSEKAFTIDAMVVLPDHVHCIWTLPGNDSDYSTRWKTIKSSFTKKYTRMVGEASARITNSMQKKGEKGIWQRRFWEHTILNEEDYRVHIEYIHYNPVKHGLVEAPKDWPYSSFHRFVKKNIYTESWGNSGVEFSNEIGGE